MKLPHDKFCILPWVSLETSPIGTVRPCCLADHEIVDDDGAKITVGEMPLDDIRNVNHMQSLRKQFLAGQKPETCRRCWAEEDAGRKSKRLHTLERLKDIVTDSDWDEKSKPLMFLDLKLGNICNLKCRICGSWSSSTFAAEEIKYQKDRKNNFHYVMMKLGQWPREETKFWQDLKRHQHNLRYLEFTGGEPFMIQEHFDLLRDLVQSGLSNNIEIHYNTNGTIFPAGAEELWRQFRRVEIAFSIDDIGPRFEYQRMNADWDSVTANIQLFREMRARNNNITLQVCSTVNVFNILYLASLAEWIDQQDFDFVYWNMLHDGPEFCIANLSPKAKHLATQILQTAHFSSTHRVEINRIIDFMNRGERDLTPELCANIRTLDQRRGQNFIEIEPELAQAIDYDFH